ncbi:PREDICTED: integumentary mucin C.1-like [Wasmannia auropunctata]|uniref:integumentary mucin C.1-like n=1 Tax=Wasmannia auropunctata TaxID=64793 RepID=UPI0005F00DAA|nr:PREDICTED: integumentary mucin C.1-like [Wasmannia auropunctata]
MKPAADNGNLLTFVSPRAAATEDVPSKGFPALGNYTGSCVLSHARPQHKCRSTVLPAARRQQGVTRSADSAPIGPCPASATPANRGVARDQLARSRCKKGVSSRRGTLYTWSRCPEIDICLRNSVIIEGGCDLPLSELAETYVSIAFDDIGTKLTATTMMSTPMTTTAMTPTTTAITPTTSTTVITAVTPTATTAVTPTATTAMTPMTTMMPSTTTTVMTPTTTAITPTTSTTATTAVTPTATTTVTPTATTAITPTTTTAATTVQAGEDIVINVPGFLDQLWITNAMTQSSQLNLVVNRNWIGATVIQHGRSIVAQQESLSSNNGIPGNSKTDGRSPLNRSLSSSNGIPANMCRQDYKQMQKDDVG